MGLMYTASGDMVPIECNPRIHSAVCTLEGHQFIGSMYADPEHVPRSDAEVVTSKPDTFRYWVMDQLFLMAGFWKPKNCFKLSLPEMATGTDAILCGDDPMLLGHVLASDPLALGPGDFARHPVAQGG